MRNLLTEAIHLPTGKKVSGHLVKNHKDLELIVDNVHPLIYVGIEKLINTNESVFINSNGGYCEAKNIYIILS